MIIGIAGRAMVGKDTFAKMIAEELNKEFYPPFLLMAFANELKIKCQKDFDLDYEQLWGKEKESIDNRYKKLNEDSYWTGREIMQAYGQFFRSIDYDFWVKFLFRLIEEKEYKNVIITDIRYKNEANAIKRNDGYLIKINRNVLKEIHGNNHVSETDLNNYNNFDFNIINDKSLDELKRTSIYVVSIIDKLNKNKNINLKGDLKNA